MPLTTYILPNVVTVNGTFKMTLYSSDATLTAPTVQTVTEIGDREDVVDYYPGIQKLNALRLSLSDDYSVSTAVGFWYKALAATTLRLYMTLDDGQGDKFWFYGTPDHKTVEWSEHYIGATPIRTGELEFVDIVQTIFDTTTASWVTQIDTGAATIGGAHTENKPSKTITFLNLFDAMLVASGLNGAFTGNVTFVYDGSNPDLRFSVSDATFTNKVLSDMVFEYKYWDGGGVEQLFTYWKDSSVTNSFQQRFATLRELLPFFLQCFGLLMRVEYNAGLGQFWIYLFQRGRAYADASRLTFGGREKESVIRGASDLYIDAVKATFLLNIAQLAWFSNRFTGYTVNNSASPNYVDFGIDITVPYRVSDMDWTADWSLFGSGGLLFLWRNGTDNVIPADRVNYYDYIGATYITPSGSYRYEEAIAGYFFRRFGQEYKMIERTYSTLQANDGTTTEAYNVQCLKRTSIDDGNGAANYFAMKVIKSAHTSELRIQWIKE